MNSSSVRSFPQFLAFEAVAQLPLSNTVILVSPSCEKLIRNRLSFSIQDLFDPKSLEAVENLLVVGGGALIDRIKYLNSTLSSPKKLIAIPSVWGSGAEVSPIAVLNEGNEKVIYMGDQYLPFGYSYCEDLALTLTQSQAKNACGDTWSHALEGFLSPLCSEPLRAKFATLIKSLLSLEIENDPRWFPLSSEACWLQSQAGVGLIHGIAHQLEGHLRSHIDESCGHAKLCSLFLLPVMHYNLTSSQKPRTLFDTYDLNPDEILKKLEPLFSQNEYQISLPVLKDKWQQVLRDPCTRLNSALVRSSSLNFFETWKHPCV